MPSDSLVSVVIASYNMGHYLATALRSALEQTYRDIEVIVIDDGSTDDTGDVVKPFLADARLRYIHQANAGQAHAKNRGIHEARGEFVAFLDADDVWLPTKLERQMPLFQEEAVGVVFCRSVEIDAQGAELRLLDFPLYRGAVSGDLLVFNFIGFSTSVVRRRCFERQGGFREDLGMGIDYELWLRLSAHYRFDFVDAPLVRYRIWAGQMSKNFERRYLNGIRIMEDFLAACPDVVEESVKRHAWAYTYTGFADSLSGTEGGSKAAFSHYLRALGYRPTYVPAWKGVVRLLLGTW
ncbi:MAG: glycosyltransferase [Thermomicrobiales bacterium]|nr:MAG: glycosyltransferase [Thermomicrobiales bacterium]